MGIFKLSCDITQNKHNGYKIYNLKVEGKRMNRRGRREKGEREEEGETDMKRAERKKKERRERSSWLWSLSRLLRTVYHETGKAMRCALGHTGLIQMTQNCSG